MPDDARSRAVTNVPAYARSPMLDVQQSGFMDLLTRRILNALPTLAGMGVGAARGATFGPGPQGSIEARFNDPSGLVDPQALGEVMILPERLAETEGTRTHELGHVSQGRYFGPFLPAAAGLAVLAAKLKGEDPSLTSPFETSAMEMGEAERQRPIPEEWRQR
jgi:hypothetical protein